MTSLTTHRPVRRAGALQITISLLVAATALVHLYLGVFTTLLVTTQPAQAESMGGALMLSVMAALFYLSFLGYVALDVAHYLPRLSRFHGLARWGLGLWAAGNIVAYAVLAQGHVDAFGLADKICEVLLVALLVVEARRA